MLNSITEEDAEYGFPWSYEVLDVVVSNQGITTLNWESPIEITGISVENAALLDFDEILERFESQVVIESSCFGADTRSRTIDIDRIALEYHRMLIKDGDRGTALLSPVWYFRLPVSHMQPKHLSAQSLRLGVKMVQSIPIFDPHQFF